MFIYLRYSLFVHCSARTHKLQSMDRKSQPVQFDMNLKPQQPKNKLHKVNKTIKAKTPTEKESSKVIDDLSALKIRYRLRYSVDKRRDPNNDTLCTKNYMAKKEMTAGLMIARCPHRVVLWTHFCKTSESVDMDLDE